jgi:hypothetical protein
MLRSCYVCVISCRVEEEQVKYIKTYYKPDDKVAAVPYLPFLVGVLVAMLAATVVVVQKTA